MVLRPPTKDSFSVLVIFFWRFGADAMEPSSESSLTIVGAYGRQNTRKTRQERNAFGLWPGINGTRTTEDRATRRLINTASITI